MRIEYTRTFLAAALFAALMFASPSARAAEDRTQIASSLSAAEANDIAVEAYIYFYPLVTMEVTRQVMSNLPPGVKAGLGPPNTFAHMRTFPPANMRDVVRPNFDTLYSSAWLDLTQEPLVVSVPDTGGRHYLLPLVDMWTNVFAVPGARTSGTKAAQWAIVPPGWSGDLPAGLQRIDAPTSHVWIIGRTQTNGEKDYEAVRKVQDGYAITPLSRWGKEAEPVSFVADPSIDMKTDPLTQVNTMPAGEFFSRAAELMKDNPASATDWSQVTRIKRLGIEPGKPFDLSKASPEVKAALERAPAEGLNRMKAKVPTMARVANGWSMNTDTMGVYGNHYLKRAIVAMVGLGANQPEDAIYPLNVADADGKPMVGEGRYVIRFARDELPPAKAFWSITMYDAEGFQVANPLNRFAIGDRDALKYNADGSLDIYIQADSPGADKESNWLPSPAKGPLGITMRLYAPKAEALEGRWNPPAVKRVE